MKFSAAHAFKNGKPSRIIFRTRIYVYRVFLNSARIATVLISPTHYYFLKEEGTSKRPDNTYMSDVGFTFLPYLYKLTKFDHQNK